MAPHERFRFRSEEEFLSKAARLGLDIPFSKDLGILFKEIKIAGKTLPNRLAVHPMEGADAQSDGSPSELTSRRYKRYGAGGCGLIWFEATAVREDGKGNPHQLMLTKKTRPAFERLAAETREAAAREWGGSHVPLLILQITHSGRFSKPEGKPKPTIAHHSPFLDPIHSLPSDYPLIQDKELGALQETYLASAALASKAGFDGVDIKACHGYLVAELLGSHTRAGSEYGGTFLNRTRFLRETAQRIISEVPGIFVTSRLSLYDSVPYPYGFGVESTNSNKMDFKEVHDLIAELVRLGFPILNFSAGIPYWKSHFGRPFDVPPRGGAVPEEHPLEGVARLLNIAASVQEAFPGLPLVGTGYSWLRRYFPNVAAAMLDAGRSTIIGLGRLSFAYPDAARDLANRGGLESRKLCTACSQCSMLLRAGGPAGCPIRDPHFRPARKRP
jgi:2,4-dienoyl-CoA reductase-like NADH-dependent reductase (Old Yellow Enzyme family)